MGKGMRIASALEVVIFSALFGVFAYFVIYRWMANEYRLAAYIYNLIFITIILALDKTADYTLRKINFSARRNKLKNFFVKLLFAAHLVSFKAGLYLFYIAMLILSRISILAPHVVNRYDISFIYSVEYGILLLLPIDKLIELLTKDSKRTLAVILKMKSK